MFSSIFKKKKKLAAVLPKMQFLKSLRLRPRVADML